MSKLRVAVICDFAEDRWYSMDLAGDMLVQHLNRDFASSIEATQIRPAMKIRFGSPRKADQFWNRFYEYPRLLAKIRGNFDLFHIVDHSYAHLVHALPPARTVVTCHDLDAFRCLIEPELDPRSPVFRAMTRRILSGLQQAAHVVCDSHQIEKEIGMHRLLPGARVSVVPLGVHPAFSPSPDAAADAEAARLLGPLREDGTDLLHVGSVVPRKRIETLLEVFAQVRARIPHARLIRAGGPFRSSQAELAARLGVTSAISVMPHLERSTLAAVYRRATLALLPSDGEGFGFPVIEAMACGTPILASDLPVLREVGGPAGFYCPVNDVGAWSKQILGLLSSRADRLEWQRIRNSVLLQANGFSWENYTSHIVRTYGQVLPRIEGKS